MTRNEFCFTLKLYVAGNEPRTSQAIANFRIFCRDFLKGKVTAEVIDLRLHPTKARTAQILATPTLVKESPGPVKKMVGTLADTDRIIAALELRSLSEGNCQ